MPNTNNTNKMKQQYKTAQNLNSRISLHQLYSTNPLGWNNWVFGNYQLQENQKILELGCGNAGIWQAHADALPTGIHLTLSDFSAGMLETAKANTSALKNADYKEIDAQSIPYQNNTFDIVIANHMLYHVPNIHKALAEIARVLKPTGTFYATTIGNDNMKEMNDLLHAFDARIDFAQGAITQAFSLQTGGEKLSRHFQSVQLSRYADSLHITQPQPLIDYILSSQGFGNVNEIISGENVARFTHFVEAIFAKHTYFDVFKDAGLFTAQAPVQ